MLKKFKKREKLEPPKKIDYFDREVFVEKIFNKLEKEHNKSESSFIFGISGHWGEGKTFLLEKLKKMLDDNNFKVVLFSPWKYVNDKTSLMRIFIKKINKELDCFNRENLSDFENDRTTVSVRFFPFILFLIILVWAIYTYVLDFINLSSQSRGIIISLFIPIFVAIIPMILSVQKSIKAISAVDQFDEKLDKIINKLDKKKKKVVVFIDDLDRIDATDAKNVLDSLRTFFDRPSISYVVTGDHKVLEAIVGLGDKEDDENQDKNSQVKREEGRRFLKKIFNVYWRIPLPTNSQLKEFIKEKIKGMEIKPSEEETITNWLIKYFDSNARNIERFIEMIKFNIELMEQREKLFKEKEEDDHLGQIHEVLSNKLLLVRAIMFQEKAHLFYEAVVKNKSIIKDVEKRIDEEQDFSDILDKIKLTESEKIFLNQFLFEEPRFYLNGGLRVRIPTFFRFASEVGLDDDRGISLEVFEKCIKDLDSDKIKLWLNSMNNKTELAQKAGEIISLETDYILKGRYLLTIFKSLSTLNSELNIFLDEVITSFGDVLENISDADIRKEILSAFYPILDKAENGPLIIEKIPFIFIEEINPPNEKLGKNSSLLFGKWFNRYIQERPLEVIKWLDSIKDKVDKQAINEVIVDQKDVVISSFINFDEAGMEAVFGYIKITDTMKNFKKYYSDNLENYNEDVQGKFINFIKSKFGDNRWRKPKVISWLGS